MSEAKNKTAVVSAKTCDLSSRRFQTQRLRTLMSTSSPEERLKNTLNNYRTMVSILIENDKIFTASNPQESVSRSLQGSLEFKICRVERQLAQIIERN